jgi:hypothetical protein
MHATQVPTDVVDKKTSYYSFLDIEAVSISYKQKNLMQISYCCLIWIFEDVKSTYMI